MLRALAVVALVSASSFMLFAARAPSSVVGPGAVIELHERLFAALDKGDARAAQELLLGTDDPISLILVDIAGRPIRADGIDGARMLLTRFVDERKQAGGSFATKIVTSTADCESPRLSYGIFDYEVAHTIGDKTTTQRCVLTSLVRYTKDGMRLFHAHASLAPDDARPVTTKKS